MQLHKAQEYKGHKGAVYALLQDASGKIFYSGGSDRYLVRWEQGIEEGRALAELSGIIYVVKDFKEDQLLVGEASGALTVFDLNSGKVIKNITLQQGPIFDILYLYDHGSIAVATGSGVLIVLDADTFSIRHSAQLCDLKLRKLSVDRSGKEVAVACGDGYIRRFSASDFSILNEFKAHEKSVYALFHKYDEDVLLSAGADAHLKAWNGGEEMQSIPAHNYAIYDLQYNAEKQVLASASRDKMIKLWNNDLDILQRVSREKDSGHAYSVNKICWLNAETLLSCGDEGIIMEWQFMV